MVTVEHDRQKCDGYRVRYSGQRFSVHCETGAEMNEAVAHYFMTCSKDTRLCPTCRAMAERRAREGKRRNCDVIPPASVIEAEGLYTK